MFFLYIQCSKKRPKLKKGREKEKCFQCKYTPVLKCVSRLFVFFLLLFFKTLQFFFVFNVDEKRIKKASENY